MHLTCTLWLILTLAAAFNSKLFHVIPMYEEFEFRSGMPATVRTIPAVAIPEPQIIPNTQVVCRLMVLSNEAQCWRGTLPPLLNRLVTAKHLRRP
ncbi:hypothetical protein TNCT_659711 [Trichonephila clavata]|uniref:Secreted protein n=1 Tax=Trichonephila clavata TaxID=2740835 RepID=A0A8X6GSV2_TRICU|nr:hypothetical protein TNCT_659711 [Trichonephila clavata]